MVWKYVHDIINKCSFIYADTQNSCVSVAYTFFSTYFLKHMWKNYMWQALIANTFLYAFIWRKEREHFKILTEILIGIVQKWHHVSFSVSTKHFWKSIQFGGVFFFINDLWVIFLSWINIATKIINQLICFAWWFIFLFNFNSRWCRQKCYGKSFICLA